MLHIHVLLRVDASICVLCRFTRTSIKIARTRLEAVEYTAICLSHRMYYREFHPCSAIVEKNPFLMFLVINVMKVYIGHEGQGTWHIIKHNVGAARGPLDAIFTLIKRCFFKGQLVRKHPVIISIVHVSPIMDQNYAKTRFFHFSNSGTLKLGMSNFILQWTSSKVE